MIIAPDAYLHVTGWQIMIICQICMLKLLHNVCTICTIFSYELGTIRAVTIVPLHVASATSAATFSVAPGLAPLLFKIYSAASILTTFKRCANSLFYFQTK